MRSFTGSTYLCGKAVERRRLISTNRMRAWIDLLLMSLTFLLTIIWNVEIGIAVSVVISLLLVVRRSSRPRMTILVRHFSFAICDRLWCSGC